MTKFLTRRLIIIAGVIVLFAGMAYFWLRPGDYISPLYKSEKIKLSIKDTYLTVDISDTPQEKITGLSNRPRLENGGGMIFVYDHPTKPTFWMKEMLFPIDIIWIGEDKKIVFVHENVSPDTFPRTFAPPRPIKYVLEVNAGFARRIQAVPGESVVF